MPAVLEMGAERAADLLTFHPPMEDTSLAELHTQERATDPEKMALQLRRRLEEILKDVPVTRITGPDELRRFGTPPTATFLRISGIPQPEAQGEVQKHRRLVEASVGETQVRVMALGAKYGSRGAEDSSIIVDVTTPELKSKLNPNSKQTVLRTYSLNLMRPAESPYPGRLPYSISSVASNGSEFPIPGHERYDLEYFNNFVSKAFPRIDNVTELPSKKPQPEQQVAEKKDQAA